MAVFCYISISALPPDIHHSYNAYLKFPHLSTDTAVNDKKYPMLFQQKSPFFSANNSTIRTYFFCNKIGLAIHTSKLSHNEDAPKTPLMRKQICIFGFSYFSLLIASFFVNQLIKIQFNRIEHFIIGHSAITIS